MTGAERADVVVVGARPAGSAVAGALARSGRRVVALDRARFPSDTLSTHLLFAGAVAEVSRCGALDRVLEVGAPRLPRAVMAGAGATVRAGYTPVDGIDYALCVRRAGLDAAFVATARAAGADVREGARVTELVWRDGRVAGVRWSEGRSSGAPARELLAPLVIGADGRGSLVARSVGAVEPHTWNRNERSCHFAYFSDPRGDWRSTAARWRAGRSLGTAFPCDDGLLLVLLMPPRERAERAFDWDAELARLPGLVERLEGCSMETKVRSALDTTSYFRRSAGPGWALVGDAGHFKDPVTAQGIRDALRFGRLLGEAVAPALDNGAAAVDAAVRGWERRRDRECAEAYAWTNTLARAAEMSPLEIELYRAAEADPAIGQRVLDVFSRVRRPSSAVSLRLAARLAGQALRRRGANRGDVMRAAAGELRDLATMHALRLRAAARSASAAPSARRPLSPR